MANDTTILAQTFPHVSYPDLDPLVTRIGLALSPPSLNDNRGHRERLLAALESTRPGLWTVPLPVLQRFPDILGPGGLALWAVVCPDTGRVVALTPGGRDGLFGLAVDLGTTTVVARLVDLTTGRAIAHRGALNRQVTLGEDLLTRIVWAREGGLAELRALAVETVNDLFGELAGAAGIGPEEIHAGVVTGNTAMTHLLLGVNPGGIPREPYLPVANSFAWQAAGEIGLHLHPAAPVWFAPNAASFLGGDVLAGVLASGMTKEEGISLLLDVGTNGEVVLGGADWLVACAGAAGPAFEGGVSKKGMRAQAGAIDHVRFDLDGRATCTTIGGDRARGLCGSELIDAVAQLFQAGHLDRTGTLRGGESFLLLAGDETADGEPISLDQDDIANFLRTKAAMYAAVDFALDRVGLTPADLDRVYLAGAIANYIDLEQAITIGLLPDIPPERFIPLGNAALEGAHLCLINRQAREDLQALASTVSYLELNAERGFMDRFTAALFLPHTDESRFPSRRTRQG